jgi:hypothetical protein
LTFSTRPEGGEDPEEGEEEVKQKEKSVAGNLTPLSGEEYVNPAECRNILVPTSGAVRRRSPP